MLYSNLRQFFLIYLIIGLLPFIGVPKVQQIIDHVAKEDDDRVVIPCDYSNVTSYPVSVLFNEVNEAGVIIKAGFVNTVKPVTRRYSLITYPDFAELIISNPERNDTNRRFQCQIQTQNGDYIILDILYILTVYCKYDWLHL
ncbi:uncharacterized protein LOC117101695 [Anneissia japonica]|uniref:uncharacterized protein LOC117101695 n=1 Tax=Anneissia japonica TaxID=1529436 RepID=UPI001425A3D4|nr:uncharacterized protein LOC117101695 [Anneissia japonica]